MNTRDNLGTAAVLFVGVLFGSALEITPLEWAAIFAAGVVIAIAYWVVVDWLRKRNERSYRRLMNPDNIRGEQLNGEFIDAEGRDSRTQK